MLENSIKILFVGSFLLLVALVIKPDLFFYTGYDSSQSPVTNKSNNQVKKNVEVERIDAYRADFQNAVEHWNPLLLSFFVNGRAVNIAVASVDQLYLQLKTLEFCTENAAVLSLQSLEELEAQCAVPILAVLRTKIDNGDFVKPINRDVSLSDTSVSSSVEQSVSTGSTTIENQESADIAEIVTTTQASIDTTEADVANENEEGTSAVSKDEEFKVEVNSDMGATHVPETPLAEHAEAISDDLSNQLESSPTQPSIIDQHESGMLSELKLHVEDEEELHLVTDETAIVTDEAQDASTA